MNGQNQDAPGNLAALAQISQILNQSLDLHQALHQSLEVIVEVMNLATGWVFLRQADGHYQLAAHYGLPAGLQPCTAVWEGSCQCNAMDRLGKLNGAVNMIQCSRIEMATGSTEGLQYHASTPLKTPRSNIGILNVAVCETGKLTQRQLALLASVGSQMAVAVERAMLFERMRSRRVREQRALLRLSNAMLAHGEPGHLAGEFTRISGEIFDADLCLGFLGAVQQGEPVFRLVAGDGARTYWPPEGTAIRPCMKALNIIWQTGRILQVLFENQAGPPRRWRLFPFSEPTSDVHREQMGQTAPFWEYWRQFEFQSGLFVPVCTVDKKRVIAMLWIFHKSRKTLAMDAHLPTLVANQAALALEQAQLHQVQKTQRALEHELHLARDIQTRFLPLAPPATNGWQWAARYEAAHQVGGDFYDFIDLGNGKYGVVVADVMGKGIPAALVMALAKTLTRTMASTYDGVLEVLRQVNHGLLDHLRLDSFLSLFYGVLDLQSGAFSYVRAGHNPPLFWRRKEAQVSFLKGTGMVLGVADAPVLEERQIQLKPGDQVVFYTDGLTEAARGDGAFFGEHRLATLLRDHHQLSAESLAEKIQTAVQQFARGAPASDDFTLVILKREG